MKKYINKISLGSLIAIVFVLSSLFFQKTILAQSLPAPTNATASPSTITCSGSSTLNATSAYTITWFTVSTGGTPIGTANGAVGFVVSPTATTTYYAEADQYASGSLILNYTGTVQTWTVPAGVSKISIDVQGAQGGSTGSLGGNGGLGGRVQTNLSVTSGSVMYFYVGGQGNNTVNSAGWNGGGNGYYGVSFHGGGGGGASDVRTGGTAITNRVIVAGGGGGASGQSGQGADRKSVV